MAACGISGCDDAVASNKVELERTQPVASEGEGAAQTPTASGSAEGEPYHPTEFWSKIPIGVCGRADGKTVLAATKDLCHSLLLGERPALVMEKAARLAAQLRTSKRPDDLLVNDVEFQRLFAVDPLVRLDLRVPAEGEARLFEKSGVRWKDDFIGSIERMTEKGAIAFGPALGCSLLRLARHSLDSVARKISLLWSKLPHRCDLCYVEMPSQKNIGALLRKYAGAKPEKVFANTVLGAIMYAYHKRDDHFDAADKGFFEFVALQSMRFYGMTLVVLIDDVRRLYECGARRYFVLTYPHCGLEPWDAYINMQQTALVDQWFWRYSRVFCGRVFNDLSYERHQRMCNLSAHLIDMRTSQPHQMKEWPILGPKYQNLVNSRANTLKLTREDLVLAKSIHDRLELEMSPKPLSNVMCAIMSGNLPNILHESEKV